MKSSIRTELQRLRRMLRTHGIWLTLLAGIDKLGRWLTGAPVWRFSRIAPCIYVGGQPAKHIFKQLVKRGVTGVVNLRFEYDYIMEVGGTNLDYLFLPVKDDDAPTMEQLERGVSFILAQLEEGGKVYVHCWEGLGRGPTMAAAYLIAGEGCSAEEAWAIIKKTRPFIRPSQKQIKRISEFAQSAQLKLFDPIE